MEIQTGLVIIGPGKGDSNTNNNSSSSSAGESRTPLKLPFLVTSIHPSLTSLDTMKKTKEIADTSAMISLYSVNR